MRFHFIVEKWLETIKPRVKESSYVKYYNLINYYILPYLSNKKVREIDTIIIDNMINGLLISGSTKNRPLSTKTVADTIALLKRIFKFSSTYLYPIQCDFDQIKFKQEEKQMRILKSDELKKLVVYLKENLTIKNAGIMLSLFTGLRLGEVCALKWSNIDLENSILYITTTMQRVQNLSIEGPKTKVYVSEPKSACSIREIPIPNMLLRLLADFSNNGSCYFLTGSSEKFIEPRNLQYHFKTVLNKALISDVNFHALRHTFATRCIEVGVDIKTLSEILGHANVNITLNRYVHPSLEEKRLNMEKLSEFLTVN